MTYQNYLKKAIYVIILLIRRTCADLMPLVKQVIVLVKYFVHSVSHEQFYHRPESFTLLHIPSSLLVPVLSRLVDFYFFFSISVTDGLLVIRAPQTSERQHAVFSTYSHSVMWILKIIITN